jgi:hypothetical protein
VGEKESTALVVKSRSLAIDNPRSRWYISKEIRELWKTIGGAAAGLAGLLLGKDPALWVVAAFATPVALGSLVSSV